MPVTVFPSARIVGQEHITFGDPVLVDDFTLIVARDPMTIGHHVHIACFSSITGGAAVTIGDYAAVSQGARILTGTDDFTGWGFGNSTVPERYRNATRAPIDIGRLCIVGANAVVLPGVTIGEGSTVGAGSVVTRDLEPWGVYVGNRRLRDRDREGVLATLASYEQEGTA
ncbi:MULTISPECIES: acyltransferase [unclassified Agrococcus]|uniref:acyltransferase n=1 Tax=unclassified Agrococcus TaxID=2615065 RepID=UPI0036121642